MKLPALLLGFGGLNLLCALSLTLATLLGLLTPYEAGIGFYLALQAVLGAALIFCGKQIAAGRDLGHKALPAVCVAYGLFLLMVWRWL